MNPAARAKKKAPKKKPKPTKKKLDFVEKKTLPGLLVAIKHAVHDTALGGHSLTLVYRTPLRFDVAVTIEPAPSFFLLDRPIGEREKI